MGNLVVTSTPKNWKNWKNNVKKNWKSNVHVVVEILFGEMCQPLHPNSSEARTSRSSKSPDPHQQNGYVRRKSSIGSADGRKSSGSGGYSGQTTSMRYSSSSSSHKISGGIREERGEYSYSENRKSSGYSKYANDGGITNGVSGILGLSSKMWSTTSKQQETFMSSTGQFLREENSTYIM